MKKVVLLVLLFGICFIGDGYAENNYPYKNVCPNGDRYFDGVDAKVCTKDGCFYKDRWDFAQCQCTSYVAYRLNNPMDDPDVGGDTDSIYGIPFNNHYLGQRWRNGGQWGAAARRAGIPVDGYPIPGDAVYFVNEAVKGSYGHVAYVESVEYDGNMKWKKLHVSEYNIQRGKYGTRTITRGSTDWLYKPVNFIHLLATINPEIYFNYYDLGYDFAGQTKEEWKKIFALVMSRYYKGNDSRYASAFQTVWSEINGEIPSGFGGGSSTGGSWQTNPGESEGTYGNDPHTPSADVHIVHLKIRREDQSHFHTESGKALSPGESVTVFAEGRIENRSNDICDYVKMEYNVTTKKKFRHTEKKTLDDDVLDEDEREDDFQPGDKISKTMRRTTITLSNDMQEVTVATEGRNSYTFPITQKHLYEKKIPLYFWLDVKVRIGNSEDRDVSCNQGSGCDEYAKFEVLLPWFNSSFNFSSVGGEAPLQVNFTNTSQTGNGATISYHWDFGDGETSNEENPVHIYNQAGTYTVSLTTTSNWGESRTSQATVTVREQPIDGIVDTNYGSTDPNNPKELTDNISQGYCLFGTASSLSGDGTVNNPWQWTCQGENGGMDEIGYAYLRNSTLNKGNLTGVIYLLLLSDN